MNTVGSFMLAQQHIPALELLFAEFTKWNSCFAAKTATEFVQQQMDLRTEGSSYAYAIQDGRQFLGVAWLSEVQHRKTAFLHFRIDPAFAGKGYATFAVRMLLEYSFTNMQLESVRSHALNEAAHRVLQKHGFGSDTCEITKQQWREFRDRPALAAFHPALKKILDAELAAGNEIAETGGGWPDPDSIFIRLKKPFLTHRSSLPAGIVYTEPNDPHWWEADYSSKSTPHHILAC